MKTSEEKRGYAQGYAAGRKRGKLDQSEAQRRARIEAFRQRAFLAALPACLAAAKWAMDGKPVNNGDDRVKLAWWMADAAVKGLRT